MVTSQTRASRIGNIGRDHCRESLQILTLETLDPESDRRRSHHQGRRIDSPSLIELTFVKSTDRGYQVHHYPQRAVPKSDISATGKSGAWLPDAEWHPSDTNRGITESSTHHILPDPRPDSP